MPAKVKKPPKKALPDTLSFAGAADTVDTEGTALGLSPLTPGDHVVSVPVSSRLTAAIPTRD